MYPLRMRPTTAEKEWKIVTAKCGMGSSHGSWFLFQNCSKAIEDQYGPVLQLLHKKIEREKKAPSMFMSGRSHVLAPFQQRFQEEVHFIRQDSKASSCVKRSGCVLMIQNAPHALSQHTHTKSAWM